MFDFGQLYLLNGKLYVTIFVAENVAFITQQLELHFKIKISEKIRRFDLAEIIFK